MAFLTWSSEHPSPWAKPTPDKSGYRNVAGCGGRRNKAPRPGCMNAGPLRKDRWTSLYRTNTEGKLKAAIRRQGLVQYSKAGTKMKKRWSASKLCVCTIVCRGLRLLARFTDTFGSAGHYPTGGVPSTLLFAAPDIPISAVPLLRPPDSSDCIAPDC